MRSGWMLAGLVAVACGKVPPRAAAPPTVIDASPSPVDAAGSSRPRAPRKREPVVVAIVVDQLAAWIAASRWPELPKDGGFARLLREGTWAKDMRLAHAVTDTAPGHASLHTGRPPVEHGIFGNEIPDAAGARVSVLRDAETRAIAADPGKSAVGSSAARLRADTVADRLRAARPDALVIGLSLKDRAAILPVGKSPTWVLWFDSGLDEVVTSSAFGARFPKWAIPVASAGAVAAARSAPWVPTDAAWLAAHAATPDDAPGEGDLDGLGTTFPHVAKTAAAFRALPASDGVLLSLASAAIAAEHDPAHPTLLSISFSAHDVVGHVFGPDSWEAWDYLRKLDAALGSFLDALEQRIGPVVVLLAADHGDSSMPEAEPARRRLPCAEKKKDPYERPCVAGERIGLEVLRDELRATTTKALGEGDWVSGVADPWIYLGAAGKAAEGDARAKLDRSVRAVLARHKGVATVFDARALDYKCPGALGSAKGVPDRARGQEDVLVLVCRSRPPGAPGDYYVVTKPGSVFDAEIVHGKGASHGTPYLYDRTVPLVVRARGEVDEGAILEDPVDFSAFAALEAHFLGLDPRPAKDILAAHTAKR